MSELCWVPKKDDAGWIENYMPRWNAIKNVYLPERKGWALYQRVSELLLSPKKRMTQDEVKIVCRGATPWKTGIFLRGRVELFTKGWMSCCWAQWEITQDKVKLVCRYAMPWKMGNFMRGRAELFTGGWVSWCWVPKRVDAENQKNNYKKNEGNRKGKYKHFV